MSGAFLFSPRRALDHPLCATTVLIERQNVFPAITPPGSPRFVIKMKNNYDDHTTVVFAAYIVGATDVVHWAIRGSIQRLPKNYSVGYILTAHAADGTEVPVATSPVVPDLPDEVAREMRDFAKGYLFGSRYGISKEELLRAVFA